MHAHKIFYRKQDDNTLWILMYWPVRVCFCDNKGTVHVQCTCCMCVHVLYMCIRVNVHTYRNACSV